MQSETQQGDVVFPVLPDDPHDRALIDLVHPADWRNPTPSGRYNLVVVGGGTAGLVSAAGAAGLGARVAIIERSLLGGDCLNVGCVPSKALIRASRAAADLRAAGQFGIRQAGEVEVDFSAVMERLRRLRSQIAQHDSASRFSSLGIDVFLGDGHFVDEHSVEVAEQRLEFKRAVIATGGRPAAPPIAGLAETGYLTNETVFSLTALPRRLAVIGGGPIGCELAQAFARLGSRVTLVEQGQRLLARDDADAAEILRQALVSDGVDVWLQAKVLQVAPTGQGRQVEVEQQGATKSLLADEILVGVGRAPNVEDLGLEAAGVEFDARDGVTVNDYLQTTNRHIYAAGDVCSKFKLTHAADAMARIVIQNALFKGWARQSSLVIPWCTYTDPEVAHVGIWAQDAAQKNIPLDTYTIPLADVDRAVLDGQQAGFVRVHTPQGKDRIVGATIVAAHAGDMIGELSLAMTARLGLKTLSRVIHPYPTQAEAIRKAADAFNRGRLTPRVGRFLQSWFAWTR